ncbi:MAG: glycosyltransferase family 2 protein [Pseudomonadota bacterium]
MTGEMSGQPQIAVIVPVWNAAATLPRAVESVLAQRDVRVEVVVVDDCSTDDSAAIARDLAARHPNVIVAVQQVNSGPAAARNRAIELSSAPWVTPLDSDDFMRPGRLRALLDHAEGEGCDFVADDLYQVPDTDIDGPARRLWSDGPIGVFRVTLDDFVAGNISAQHGGRREMGFVKPLIRKTFLEKHALTYAEDMRLGEDYELYAKALLAGARFDLIDPQGYVAVIRAGSLSGQHGARELGALVAADRRLLQSPGLPPASRALLRQHLHETEIRWRWARLIDAVKARNPVRALGCFAAPLGVVSALLGLLGEQMRLRGGRRLAAMIGKR